MLIAQDVQDVFLLQHGQKHTYSDT